MILTTMIHLFLFSYLLWEKVVGGRVQGSLCDASTNPVLLFNTYGATELVTMPLNLTEIRYAGIFLGNKLRVGAN